MDFRLIIGAAVAASLLAGCAAQKGAHAPMKPATSAAASSATQAQVAEYYVVLPEDGRYYAFGDFKQYQEYLAHGEIAFTRTRIGVGPTGQTVVFGISAEDVKSGAPAQVELLYDGKAAPTHQFYGEVFKDGRYYVFDDLKALQEFAAFGEVPYAYTDIGAAPDGKTVVWVMDKKSYTKGKPAQRIQRFLELRNTRQAH